MITVMPPGSPKKDKGIGDWLLPIVLSALLLGCLFGFYDYVRQYTASWSVSRKISHETVQSDTESTIIRRFLIGASTGAILGLLIAMRSRDKDSPGNDA